VLASHYLDAAQADPDADDAGAIMARARETLIAAGERSAGLAAAEQATAYYAHAAELTEDPVERAGLLERAGLAALRAGAFDQAEERYETAIELLDAAGERGHAAVVSARLARLAESRGRVAEAIERLRSSYAVLAEDEPGPDLAEVAVQLSVLESYTGDEQADAHVETALEISERLRRPDLIARALNVKHILLTQRGRPEEALALLKHALELSLEHDHAEVATRVRNNLGEVFATIGRREDALAEFEAGLELARRRGDRLWEGLLLSPMPLQLFHLGRWDEALEIVAEVEKHPDELARLDAARASVLIAVARGGAVPEQPPTIGDLASDRIEAGTSEALVAAAGAESRGDAAAALSIVRGDLDKRTDSLLDESRLELVRIGLESALELGDLSETDRLLDHARSLLEGNDARYLEAIVRRFDARTAARREEIATAVPRYQAAIQSFRSLDDPFAVAVVRLELAEDLGDSPEAEGLRAEARETFERLGARPWVQRAGGAPADRPARAEAVHETA
jgi:tetratricopeptide (TPR) repeat protein